MQRNVAFACALIDWLIDCGFLQQHSLKFAFALSGLPERGFLQQHSLTLAFALSGLPERGHWCRAAD